MDVSPMAASPLSENELMMNTPISSNTQRKAGVYMWILDVAVWLPGFQSDLSGN